MYTKIQYFPELRSRRIEAQAVYTLQMLVTPLIVYQLSILQTAGSSSVIYLVMIAVRWYQHSILPCDHR
jgi:hypothetical protein